jgi:hypothetical protein
MPKLKPTSESLANIAKRDVVINPGQYRAKVASHEEKSSKDGESLNDIFIFQGLEGDFANAADIRVYCSEKEPERASLVKLFNACGIKIEANESYDPSALVDYELRVEVINERTSWDTNNPNRIVNKIVDFLPL